jgi:hypothetical protein
MTTVYCISGLGADHHIFDGLDVPDVQWVHLPWLMPDGDELIAGYAARMKAGIINASRPREDASLPREDASRPAGDASPISGSGIARGFLWRDDGHRDRQIVSARDGDPCIEYPALATVAASHQNDDAPGSGQMDAAGQPTAVGPVAGLFSGCGDVSRLASGQRIPRECRSALSAMVYPEYCGLAKRMAAGIPFSSSWQ